MKDAAEERRSKAPDSGLLCLVALCRFHQIPVDVAQLAREYRHGNQSLNDVDIQRAAKAIGLHCRHVVPDKKHGKQFPRESLLPAIAKRVDGSYVVLARHGNQQVLIHDIRCAQPEVLDEAVFLTQWSGELLLLARRSSLSENFHRHFNLSWFIPVLMKYRRLFAEVIIASFFLQVFALATPLFFQVVMDKVLVHNGLSTLDVLAVGFFAVVVFETLLSGLRTYLFSHTTNRVDVELGSALYKHLLRLPLAYFQTRAVGQSVARVRELDSIRNFITGSALTLCVDLLFAFVFLAVMLYYSMSLSVVVLLTIPLYVLLSVISAPILKTRVEDKFKYSAANQSFLVESISGAETVKSLALEPMMQRQWEEHLANGVASGFRAQHLNNIASQAASFINKLMTLGILWWGAQQVMQGALSVGQLIAFNMLASRISGPILKLVQLAQDVQQAKISLQRLGDILNTPSETHFNPQRSVLPSLKGEIRFERVRFRYQQDRALALEDLSLHIKAGEIVGIVGSSGSGKSTLTKLLQRLYVPEAGKVLVDGVDLATVDTAWLRSKIGVVLQNSFLFNKTIRENIAVTQPSATMEAVVRAAQLAGAHAFISALPQGYDAMVEEQGSNLSGGQKQRIAIARALLQQPRILIFDEATSALDVESERTIQANMAAICRGRTVFVIAHRLSTVQGCDRIVVMEQGKIVEQGSHAILLNKNGRYAQMYRYQNEVIPLRQTENTALNSARCA
ncbi:MAG: type I secretion system permease/ATPase [Pseudomonadales bacterium]